MDTRTFTFTTTTEDSRLSLTKNYDEGVTWDEVLEDFVSFMEGAGYVGMRKRVSVAYSPFVDAWTGPVHKDETDE